MVKDFLAFLNHIEELEVSTREAMVLIHLFKQHNTKFGYAYPTFKNIGEATKTKSDKTIESTIEKLEKANLIKVDRKNKNNRYYIVGIENFLIDSKIKKVAKAVKKTIEKVEEVATELVEDVKEAVEAVAEEVKTFIPTQKFNNANIVDDAEESIEVVESQEIEENPFNQFLKRRAEEQAINEIMPYAKAMNIVGGTYKCYARLIMTYGVDMVKNAIDFAFAKIDEYKNKDNYFNVVEDKCKALYKRLELA